MLQQLSENLWSFICVLCFAPLWSLGEYVVFIYFWNYLNIYKAWIANIQIHYKRKHSHYSKTSMNKLKQESLVRKYLLKIMDLESTYIDGLWCIYISIAIWHWEVSKRDGESNQTELFGNLTGNTFISVGISKQKEGTKSKIKRWSPSLVGPNN